MDLTKEIKDASVDELMETVKHVETSVKSMKISGLTKKLFIKIYFACSEELSSRGYSEYDKEDQGQIEVDGRIVVTAVELYKISKYPEFVAQSKVDDDGNYVMIWNINGKKYQTNNSIF